MESHELKEINRDRLLDEVSIQLHSAMQSRGLSKADLCRKLGVKPPSVSKMLAGRNNFRLETLADVFFELGLAVHVTTSREVARLQQPSVASNNPGPLELFQAPEALRITGEEWYQVSVPMDAPEATRYLPPLPNDALVACA